MGGRGQLRYAVAWLAACAGACTDANGAHDPSGRDPSALPQAGSAPMLLAGRSALPVNAPDTPAQGAAGSAPATGGGSGTQPVVDPPQPTVPDPTEPPAPADEPLPTARIYWLEIGGSGVFTARADGSDAMRVVSALAAPDGVAADDCTGSVYVSNMGSSLGGGGQASVQRWDGERMETLIEPGSGIDTAKQLTLDLVRGHVYVADREGATLWRSALDGSGLERVVTEHGFDQLVGVAVDPEGGHVYFTDRNARRVHRVGLDMPAGETAETRTDLETLYQTGTGTMPIDLALDLDARVLYLTDRGLGVVKRMGMELPAGEDAATRTDVETLVDGLGDPIGVAVAPHEDALYFTELTGAIHRARLDGSGDEVIANSGSATGIALSALEDPGKPLECE